MTTKNTNPWIVSSKPKPDAKLRLFCLPYAGGGTMIYRTWSNFLPESVAVCAVQLPGRGPRLREPLYTQLVPLAHAIAAGLATHYDKPFAFFGHSMGAMLSFEIARQLRRAYGISPVHLYVSGRRAPQVDDPGPASYNLPHDEFIAELSRIKGTPQEVLENPELMQMLIPIIRADFEVCQTYQYTDEPPLECPISAFGGIEDDEETREKVEAWQQQTSKKFSSRMIPGDHFFIHSSERLILELLSRELHEDLGNIR